uniref:DUF4471 domain-containing protein n=1 Tax=Mesocestoides corti TaxID=53468 RepID=A0A5K3FIU4_MESCO
MFHPYVSLVKLKSKDRDHLECTLKSWRRKNLPKFEISTYWNSRVRQHLGVRYDAIPNVFDWDCSITLRDRGIKTLDSREYSRWRETGVAFTPRQASYLAPNRTLASPRYFSHRVSSGSLGGSTLIGYWGDIVCSPYLAFGTSTDRSPELNRSLPGGRVLYGASLLSEVNLMCLFWELHHGRPAPASFVSTLIGQDRKFDKFDKSKDEETDGQSNDREVGEDEESQTRGKPDGDLTETNNSETQIKGNSDSTSTESHTIESHGDTTGSETKSEEATSSKPNIEALDETAHLPADEGSVNLCERFQVDFYSPGTTIVDLSTRLRSQFEDDANKASVIYVGCSSLILLSNATQSLLDVCTHDCRLIVESVLYIVGLKEEAIRNYVKRAGEIASSVGFKWVKPADPMKDHHLFFIRDSNQEHTC